VTSEGYSTFAQLPKENYEKLRGEIPELDVEMRSFILQMYNDDPLKQWAFETIKQLPFLQDLEEEKEWIMLHNVYHAMIRKHIPRGHLLYKAGEAIDKLTVVQDGVLELIVRIALNSTLNRWKLGVRRSYSRD